MNCRNLIQSIRNQKEKINIRNYRQLKKKKHPYCGRVGQTADMMLQFYRAKLELPLEEESNITLESVIEEDNLHTTLNPTETSHLQGVKDSKGILNIEPIEFRSSFSDCYLK